MAPSKQQESSKVLGDRHYPCHCRKRINTPTEAGVFSRRCPSCKTYWILHVEPTQLGERMGRPILKMRWDTR